MIVPLLVFFTSLHLKKKMLMKYAVMSPVFKRASLRGLVFSILALFVGVFAQGQDMTLRDILIGESRDFAPFGGNWFSNVNVDGSIGVRGYCFPKNRTHQDLNELVTRVIRGRLEDPLVQIRFSGGRFSHYVCAASLIKFRLQSVEYTIEQVSSRINALLRQFRVRGISNQSLIVLLLTDLQHELGAYRFELDDVRALDIDERQDFFERFCRFYAGMFHPFAAWVESQDFDPDHFHDAFWTVNIVDALHPETVIEPERYEGGPEAWCVLNERTQGTLRGQYFDSLPYVLAQWELYKLRALLLIQELNRVEAPGCEEVVTWLEEELDTDLQFRTYFSEDRWTEPNRYVRDINNAFDDYVNGATRLDDLDVELSDDEDEFSEGFGHNERLTVPAAPDPGTFADQMNINVFLGTGFGSFI